MDIEFESELDACFNKLVDGAISQKDVALNVHKSMGIGTQCLVYYVAGIIDSNLQRDLVRIYESKGKKDELLLEEVWKSYWPKKLKLLIEQLQKIYGL